MAHADSHQVPQSDCPAGERCVAEYFPILRLNNLDLLLNRDTMIDVVCCDVLDVPEVVYPCDSETEAGPRSPVPAARHGGRVCDAHFLFIMKQTLLTVTQE